MIFRQLFDRESCTYTYILGDEETREAVVIDPVLELVERDITTLNELDLKVVYAINTHIHADHITGSGKMKKSLKYTCQSVLGLKGNEYNDILADWKVKEHENIKVGKTIFLEPIHTPGHTQSCHSFVLRNVESTRAEDALAVFTGDTVLIRGCGRTDFQGGSAAALYKSVHEKIYTLPDACKIYPAHDYKGRMESTVAEEKKFNPRLNNSLDKFVEIMDNLKLDYPAKIDVSLPANKVCGLHNL